MVLRPVGSFFLLPPIPFCNLAQRAISGFAFAFGTLSPRAHIAGKQGEKYGKSIFRSILERQAFQG